MLLGGDLSAEWSDHPTSVISSLDGVADITPADPERRATNRCALAVVHALPSERLVGLPSAFDHSGGSPDALKGPLAAEVRSRWAQVTAAPEVLTHSDYWSGNVVWRDGRLTGIVDMLWRCTWVHAASILAGAGLISFSCSTSKSPTSFSGPTTPRSPGRPVTWASGMAGATARSHDRVETWVPNYAPLGRADLDEHELRRRHSRWTTRLLETNPRA